MAEKSEIKKRTPIVTRNVAYLRVSSSDQDTAKNQAAVLKFANDRLW